MPPPRKAKKRVGAFCQLSRGGVMERPAVNLAFAAWVATWTERRPLPALEESAAGRNAPEFEKGPAPRKSPRGAPR
jgi:hypothetical protein